MGPQGSRGRKSGATLRYSLELAMVADCVVRLKEREAAEIFRRFLA